MKVLVARAVLVEVTVAVAVKVWVGAAGETGPLELPQAMSKKMTAARNADIPMTRSFIERLPFISLE